MNELKKSFQDGAFIPYIVAGDPDYKKSLEIAKKIIDAGADALEIGIPFTDPAADGPTIQKAYARSLNNGFKVKQIYQYIKEIRKYSDIPIILLTYYNIVYNQGIENFYQKTEKIGVNGVIIADMPPEESKQVTKKIKDKKINQIFLVAPTTTEKRIKTISEKGSGFIYVVSRLGVTGKRKNFQETTKKLIKKVKSNTDLPVAVGFGITKPSHVKKARKAGADGVIVGSAIVDKIEKNKKNQQITQYIKKMKQKI
ncbi:MAG: Tryptophan synthase alpha chain [Candidatus Methanohalarchaeum thermophilum]|uniref:Tryptophan synthase alpha chain n=1 Tax=Methanohalarchaeum thermophilum TaxID=1903181 RepID=A0A1Q6DSD0_METT1|nr:MAG: Tryptophan synthase alpha chain [Candidatus Methanohalarchaeum thermophilum]